MQKIVIQGWHAISAVYSREMGDDPIFALRQKFIESLKAGDIVGLVSLYADDVVIMSPNDSTLYGSAEAREWHQEYFQSFRIEAYSEPQRHALIEGDFATEWTTYMIAIVPVGSTGRIRDDGRFLTIWKRGTDGAWKIWQMMWNSEKPIGSGTNRYMWRAAQKDKRSQGSST